MFSQTQLDFIQKCARERKNQGEVSVYILALKLAMDGFLWEGFTKQQSDILKFCAEECKRQRSGEMSVYDMCVAWSNAYAFYSVMKSNQINARISLDFIEEIGKLVEPIDNKKGFRTIPIGVTDVDDTGRPIWIEKAQYGEIPRLLEHLLASYYEGFLGIQVDTENGGHTIPIKGPSNIACELPEDEFYFEYEQIHPFVDGNGRSGKILYNYLKGTLDNPVMPPNFFGGSNP